MGLKKLILCKIDFLEKYGSPLLLLGVRLYMANIFFKSGWLKFENYLNGQWDNTLMLFEYEHPVVLREDIAKSLGIEPIELLPHDVAAVLATGGEIILP